MAAEDDPASENLDVYDTRTGWWHPVIGEISLPDGWEFLASGDAFVTRRVKAGGVYWTAWKPKNRRGGHRRRLGLLAPGAAVDEEPVNIERPERVHGCVLPRVRPQSKRAVRDRGQRRASRGCVPSDRMNASAHT